jgi:hypothetical protein
MWQWIKEFGNHKSGGSRVRDLEFRKGRETQTIVGRSKIRSWIVPHKFSSLDTSYNSVINT